MKICTCFDKPPASTMMHRCIFIPTSVSVWVRRGRNFLSSKKIEETLTKIKFYNGTTEMSKNVWKCKNAAHRKQAGRQQSVDAISRFHTWQSCYFLLRLPSNYVPFDSGYNGVLFCNRAQMSENIPNEVSVRDKGLQVRSIRDSE